MKFTGTLCRAARVAANLSNSELAALAGVGVNTVSRFEQGNDVRLSSADAIREALEAKGIVFTSAGQPASVDSVGINGAS